MVSPNFRYPVAWLEVARADLNKGVCGHSNRGTVD